MGTRRPGPAPELLSQCTGYCGQGLGELRGLTSLALPPLVAVAPLLDGNRQCPGHQRLNFLFRHKFPVSVCSGPAAALMVRTGGLQELLQIPSESGARTFLDSGGGGGLLSVAICPTWESGLGVGEGWDPRPFRLLSLFGCPPKPHPAGNPRSFEPGLRASSARGGLFRFRKICRGRGPAGPVLVFWVALVSRRWGEGRALLTHGPWGTEAVRTAEVVGAAALETVQVPSSSLRRPVAGVSFPHRSSGSCVRQAGWPDWRLPGKSCGLLVLGGVD